MCWLANSINCYGVGDCLIGAQFLTSDGGFRDEADEGAHPFDIQIQEDPQVYQGTCTGMHTGSTVVKVSATCRQRERRARDDTLSIRIRRRCCRRDR